MGVQEIAQIGALKQLLYNETYDISSLFYVDKLRAIILTAPLYQNMFDCKCGTCLITSTTLLSFVCFIH